jgi:hypothetical protein
LDPVRLITIGWLLDLYAHGASRHLSNSVVSFDAGWGEFEGQQLLRDILSYLTGDPQRIACELIIFRS